MSSIDSIKDALFARVAVSDSPREFLRAPELRTLASEIKNIPNDQKAAYGKSLNEFKQELTSRIEAREAELADAAVISIDVPAPWGVNESRPEL